METKHTKNEISKQLPPKLTTENLPQKLAMDTTELAWSLSISRPFAYELMRREDFPKSFRIGSKRLHSVDAVREWIKQQVQEANQ